MKTIFLTIYDGDTEKNILRSNVFPLLKKAGLRIIVLVKKKFIDYYQQNFADSQVVVEGFPDSRNFLEKIYYWIGWNSIPTFTISLRRKRRYLKHRNSIRYIVENIIGLLGRFKVWRNFLRWSYFLIPDDYCQELFKKYKPDLLFAPNMFSREDGKLLRLAKKIGVKTVTTVKSWDVLTSKAFTRILADRILVFNEYNKKEAVELGDYNPEQVRVVGFPQFDIYKRKEVLLSREEFFKKIGADPKKKLILYASPGNWKSPHDHEVLLGLHKAITEGKIKEPIQILVRFHPKYPSYSEYLKYLPNFIFDRPGTYLSKGTHRPLIGVTDKAFHWTFQDKDIIHLASSLYHSDIVINTESTIALDSANFDKPIIFIGYDGFQELDYLHSIRHRYDFEHYSNVIKTKGVRLARTEGELIKYINNYLENPELDKKGRELLREKLLYKCDGKSGERVVKAILEHLNN